MYLQKVIIKQIRQNLFFVSSWNSLTKRAGSWSVNQVYGSQDPDLYQNVTDPDHCPVTPSQPCKNSTPLPATMYHHRRLFVTSSHWLEILRGRQWRTCLPNMLHYFSSTSWAQKLPENLNLCTITFPCDLYLITMLAKKSCFKFAFVRTLHSRFILSLSGTQGSRQCLHKWLGTDGIKQQIERHVKHMNLLSWALKKFIMVSNFIYLSNRK